MSLPESTEEKLARRIARLENDQQQVRGIEKKLSVLANAIAKLEAKVASLDEKLEQLDKQMWRHIDPEWE